VWEKSIFDGKTVIDDSMAGANTNNFKACAAYEIIVNIFVKYDLASILYW